MAWVKAVLLSVIVWAAWATPLAAQGRYTDKANDAVALSVRVTDHVENSLERVFSKAGDITPERREEVCAAVAQAVQIDNEAVDYILSDIANLPDNNTPNYMYRDIYSAQRILTNGAATYRLDRADAYLSFDCLAEADGLYREVLRIFSSGPYDGFRMRASVGIEDIRSRRAALSSLAEEE